MKKLLTCLVAVLIAIPTMAEHHKSAEAEVYAAINAFNDAYATNDVEGYFGHYTDDATLYFSGARQKVADYHEEWTALVDAGGGVEKNETAVWQKIDGEWKIVSLHYTEIAPDE
jgi:ketosteroid isomerase-like protein